MTTTHFPLTIRREDVLEIYRVHFQFSLWDPHVLRLVLAALIAAGAAAFAYWKMSENTDFAILVFFSGIAFLGISTHLVVTFAEKRKAKHRMNRWIDSFIHFKDHQLIVEDTRILYQSEKGLMVFLFSDMVDLHVGDGYHSISCTGEHQISIPLKAFAAGDADRFGELAQAKFARYLAQNAILPAADAAATAPVNQAE